jgi:flagellar biogenesis protein FliO
MQSSDVVFVLLGLGAFFLFVGLLAWLDERVLERRR